MHDNRHNPERAARNRALPDNCPTSLQTDHDAPGVFDLAHGGMAVSFTLAHSNQLVAGCECNIAHTARLQPARQIGVYSNMGSGGPIKLLSQLQSDQVFC